jgi:signal transduction histidine kinase
VCGLTWVAVAGDNVLPRLFLDAIHISTFGQHISAVVALLSVLALGLLWLRWRSVLDLWLMVVLCAWLFEIAFFVLVTALRFSLAFYASRMYALVTATVVLLLLLSEVTMLYARLVHSIQAERREREARLVTTEAIVLAHEINQPLVAITNYALAARQRLANGEAAKVEELIDKIGTQAARAGDFLQSLRAKVKTHQLEMTKLDVGRLVTDSMKLVEVESHNTEIGIKVSVPPDLPLILADDVQIQQVVLNLTHADRGDGGRWGGQRCVNVGLKRRGIGSHGERGRSRPRHCTDKIERIFAPFYSTKGSGLGIGPSLSRAIVEAHGGQLTVMPNAGGGSVFRFTLPTAHDGD